MCQFNLIHEYRNNQITPKENQIQKSISYSAID